MSIVVCIKLIALPRDRGARRADVTFSSLDFTLLSITLTCSAEADLSQSSPFFLRGNVEGFNETELFGGAIHDCTRAAILNSLNKEKVLRPKEMRPVFFGKMKFAGSNHSGGIPLSRLDAFTADFKLAAESFESRSRRARFILATARNRPSLNFHLDRTFIEFNAQGNGCRVLQ